MNARHAHTVLGVLALVLAWFGITALGAIDPFFLPGPAAVFSELALLLASGVILPDLIATLFRVALAFGIALVVGVPAGLLLGSSQKLYTSFEFVIDFFRSLPATAIFPLFMLLFGIGDGSKISVAVFGAVLIILFNTAHGVRHANQYRIKAIKLMGATKTQVFSKISFWESLPQTFAGIRIAISITLIIVIVTEMFIGTQLGLGKAIIDFQYIYHIKGMYAAIILTGLLGYAFNKLFVIAEKKTIHWSG